MDEAQPLASVPPVERSPTCRWVRGLQAIGVLCCLGFLMFVGVIFLSPRGLPPRAQGKLTACKANCRMVATALEMYAGDNQGHYPLALNRLTSGNYLKRIPTCPAAGKMTYENYQVTTEPDNFSFACCGSYHSKAYDHEVVNLPSYNGQEGLRDR